MTDPGDPGLVSTARYCGRLRQEGHDGGRLAAEARVDRLHLLRAAEEEHQPDRELRHDQRVSPPELTGLAAPGALTPEGAGGSQV